MIFEVVNMSIYRVHNMLITLGICFLPIIGSFRTYNGANLLGGFGEDASTYPLLLGVLFWLIGVVINKKIHLPNSITFYICLLFIFSIVVSDIVNFKNIILEQRTSQNAVNRMIIQFGTVFIYGLVSVYIYNFFKVYQIDAVKYIEKRIIASFLLAGAYSFIEILSYTGTPFIDILIFIDEIIRGGYNMYPFRIRLLGFEASVFGTYLSVACPLILYKAINSKKYTCLAVYMLLLTGLSFSRTAYVIVFVETVLLFILYRNYLIHHSKKIFVGIMILLLMSSFAANYMENTYNIKLMEPAQIIDSLAGESETHEMSNLTRVGSQMAGYNIFFDNPFVGVGWGQGTFYLNDYYPSWARQSWEVAVKFRDHPIIFGVYPRVLAELGLLGFVSWVSLWMLVVYKLFCLNNNVFAIMMIGILLSGMNMDIVRFYIYWIMLGMVWYISDNNIED